MSIMQEAKSEIREKQTKHDIETSYTTPAVASRVSSEIVPEMGVARMWV
jgi:hypothetical protein